jgi:hypothetical protein
MDTSFNYSGFVDLFLGPEERAGTPGADAVSARGAAPPRPAERAPATEGPAARPGPRTPDP